MNRLGNVIPDTIPNEDGKKRRQRRSKEEIASDLEARLAKVTGRDSSLDLKTPRSMEKELAVFVGQTNALLYLTPWTYNDALNNVEATALIQGWDSAQMTDPKFRKWTQKFVGNSGKVGLIGALSMIGIARLIRHNILPVPDAARAEMNKQLEQMYMQMAAQMQEQQEQQERMRQQQEETAQPVQPLSEVYAEAAG